MTNNEAKIVNKIRGQYESIEAKEPTDLEKLKELDKRVKRPVQIFSYSLGTAGSLVLGTGMTMAMSLIPGGMAVGIAVGCVGLLTTGLNYKLHQKLLRSRKKKYSEEITALSNKILNENN